MSTAHPERIGKYEIASILGEGGMGVVYLGRDPLIDRTVAIKTIRTGEGIGEGELVERLKAEAKSAGRLHHPNIVTIFEFGQQDDLYYLVMEFVEGRNLARIIESGAGIPLDTKIDMLLQVCQGLDYAHDLGVTHRDIKPSNICITPRGTPKILDFGLARFDDTRRTRTGFVSGTVSYMSPERMRGINTKSDDVFALGAVAYELLTGQVAFPGKSYSEVVAKILSENHPPPPSTVAPLPAALDAVIMKALVRNPAERYASAGEFAHALWIYRRSEEHRNTCELEASAPPTGAIDAFVPTRNSGSNPYSAPELMPGVPDSLPSPAPEVIGKTAIRDSKPAVDFDDSGIPRRATITPAELSNRHVTPPPFPPAAIPEAPTVIEQRTAPGPAGPAREDEVGEARTVMESRPGNLPLFAPPEAPPVAPRAAAPSAAGDAPPAPSAGASQPLSQWRERIPAAALQIALPAAAVAILTIAAAVMQASSGLPLYLVVYAAALAAWGWLVSKLRHVTLVTALAAGAALRTVALLLPGGTGAETYRALWDGRMIAAGVNPYAVSPSDPSLALHQQVEWFAAIANPAAAASHPPGAELLFLIAAWLGGSVLVLSILAMIADLGIVYLLARSDEPRRAFAYAMFPLVVLEGVRNGRVEVAAALLLFLAFTLAKRERAGAGGVAAAAGVSVALIAAPALPALFAAAKQRFVIFFTAVLAFSVPLFVFPTHGRVTAAIHDALLGFPPLSTLHGWLQTHLAASGFDQTLRSSLLKTGESLAPLAATITAPAIASTILLGLLGAMMVTVTLLSRSAPAAVANSLGIFLVASLYGHPAAWLLVVPFAMAANRPLWIFFAAASPLVLLASPGLAADDLVIRGIALAVPLLLVAAVRLRSRNDRGRDARFLGLSPAA
jgi:serine/threonine protein kinase